MRSSLPDGWPENDRCDADSSSVLPYEVIYTFFNRRPSLRPADWPLLAAGIPVDRKRMRMLSVFIRGYLRGRP